jgi:hypothetical protein
MRSRNVSKHVGWYRAKTHSLFGAEGHVVKEVRLSEEDILAEVEQYQFHHGSPGRTPVSTQGFIAWWNRISDDTVCSCGVMPKLELFEKIN